MERGRLGGICDRHQRICFALALWNERDPILKERLFGLTGNEGNHGEDVKEQYFYLDSTPTHSYMKFLYKYPQAAFPYDRAGRARTAAAGRGEPEFELIDTGIFDDDRYFDVFVEYAKASAEDILIEITAFNRGPEAAPLHLLPTVWFRNTWSWAGRRPPPGAVAPVPTRTLASIVIDEPTYGRRWLHCEGNAGVALHRERDQHPSALFGAPGPAIRQGRDQRRGRRWTPSRQSTPSGGAPRRRPTRRVVVPPGGQVRLRLRLTDTDAGRRAEGPFGEAFDRTFATRRREADEFYETLPPASDTPEARQVMRQAFAGSALVKAVLSLRGEGLD